MDNQAFDARTILTIALSSLTVETITAIMQLPVMELNKAFQNALSAAEVGLQIPYTARMWETIEAHWKAGKKIHAIKIFRDLYKEHSLLDCKIAVEKEMVRRGHAPFGVAN